MSGPNPRSGLDGEGNWTPAFAGQREPARQGNDLAVRHGAYATLRLAPRAEEIAARLREIAPAYDERQDIFVVTAAMIGARFEVAMETLIEADAEANVEQLDLRAHRWAKLWVSALDRLGLTPLAAAKLGLDLTRAKGAALAAHLAEQYGQEDERS